MQPARVLKLFAVALGEMADGFFQGVATLACEGGDLKEGLLREGVLVAEGLDHFRGAFDIDFVECDEEGLFEKRWAVGNEFFA